MNILIVEDNRTIRLLVEKLIDRYSGVYCNLFLVDDVNSALGILERNKIDGAIIDLVLPDGTGLTVAKECENREVPVVFCTSTHDDHNLELMYKYGWVIGKPVLQSAISQAIRYFNSLKRSAL